MSRRKLQINSGHRIKLFHSKVIEKNVKKMKKVIEAQLRPVKIKPWFFLGCKDQSSSCFCFTDT